MYQGISAPKGSSDYVRQLSAAVKRACDGPGFKGLVPTKAEIQAERERSSKLKDLEGLDTANVLGGGAKRRRPAPPGRPPLRASAAASDSEDGSSSASGYVEAAAGAHAGDVDSDVFSEESE